MTQQLKALDGVFWGRGTLLLLMGTGILLTLRMRFLPWRNLGKALSMALGRKSRQTPEDGGVSPFSALMTALAATIGTGNIVGVAAALAAGGPGALFWMEISALFGMSSKLAECMLAVKYRRRDRKGQPCGGPMYVLRDALGLPALGALFALFAVCTSFGVGGMAQSGSIAGALSAAFGILPLASGCAAAALALAVISGGAEGVAAAASRLVPAMAAFYLAAGILVIFRCRENLPAALMTIFREAFSLRAAAGGAAGTTLSAAFRWGMARGVFSHEAGMGSGAIAAASAGGHDAVRQGYVSMTGVFFDTCAVCTVTGLVICVSGVLDAAGADGADGAALTLLAFRQALGPLGAGLVGLCVVLFAFTTILGWAYQGEQAFAYLSGGKLLPLYRTAFLGSVLLGGAVKLEAVFYLADICNALMCVPNLLSLLLLSGDAAREVLAYQPKLSGRKKGPTHHSIKRNLP